MADAYYDAIVLGMDMGPLCAGALLARRGYRVLVLGHRHRPAVMTAEGIRWATRPVTACNAGSAAVTRVFSELGILQQWRRLAASPAVHFQAVTPDLRVDVLTDPLELEAELHRLFPNCGAAGGFLHHLGRLAGECDKLLLHDLVLPPESFFERREAARVEVQHPFAGTPHADPLAAAGVPQDIAQIVSLPLHHVHPVGSPQALRTIRIVAGWLFDAASLGAGADDLTKAVLTAAVGYGADARPELAASAVAVKRGKVTGVRIADREDRIACRWVLTSAAPRDAAALVDAAEWTDRFETTVREDAPELVGCCVNFAVDPAVLPQPMADTLFLDTGDGLVMRVDRVPQSRDDIAVLLASGFAATDADPLRVSERLRDLFLDALRRVIPFFDGHLKAVYSPQCTDGIVHLDDRAPANTAVPVGVPWRCRLPGPEAWGLASLPHRSGVRGLLFCGDDVLPGLGIEGHLLTAWGAAHIVEKGATRKAVVRALRGGATTDRR